MWQHIGVNLSKIMINSPPMLCPQQLVHHRIQHIRYSHKLSQTKRFKAVVWPVNVIWIVVMIWIVSFTKRFVMKKKKKMNLEAVVQRPAAKIWLILSMLLLMMLLLMLASELRQMLHPTQFDLVIQRNSKKGNLSQRPYKGFESLYRCC